LTLVSYIGSVGSGKTTRVKDYPKKEGRGDGCILFMPGQILRAAIGPGFFATEDGNAPRVCDEFVFGQWLQHFEFARKTGAVTVVSDGWPRTALQAAALVQWLHRSGNRITVYPHHLICSEDEWERRLKGDRWLQNPELEAIDRRRYAQSIEDSLGSISVLRSTGEPFVKAVQIHMENAPQ
jgi:hypothetical protein